jgi:autotransporter-associated beta strand protein
MTNFTKMRIEFAFLFLMFVLLSAHAQASNVSWNVSSGNFSAAANWSPTHFPYSGDTALINNGGTALLGATSPPNSISSLTIGSASGYSGTLTQSNQTLTVTGEIWIGNGGGTATYNMSGGTLNAQSWFSIARHYPLSDPTGTVGIVNFSGGIINKSGGGDFNICERGAGNQGTLNMSGTAVLNVNVGNVVLAGGGDGSGGTATIIMNGGTINLTTATPGGWAWYPQFMIGVGSSTSTGSFTLNSGTLNAGGWICVGRELSTGTVTINGGTLNKYDTEGDIIIGSTNPFNTSSSAGTGTWNQNGGTVYNPTRLILGQTGGSGTFNLKGGLVQAAAVGGGAGTSTFNFNGGTLQAVGDQSAYLQGLDKAYVKEGGAKIDTQGYDITIAQVLQHGGAVTLDGGLIKSGAGTLTITQNATYTGNTTVSGGILDMLNINTPAATVSVVNNSALTANSIVADTLNIGSGGTGVVESLSGDSISSSSLSPVPEPGTLVLLATAALATLVAVWWKK